MICKINLSCKALYNLEPKRNVLRLILTCAKQKNNELEQTMKNG